MEFACVPEEETMTTEAQVILKARKFSKLKIVPKNEG